MECCKQDLSKTYFFSEKERNTKESENAQPYQHLKLANSYDTEKKFRKHPMKKAKSNNDTSRKFPAVTCPPGNKAKTELSMYASLLFLRLNRPKMRGKHDGAATLSDASHGGRCVQTWKGREKKRERKKERKKEREREIRIKYRGKGGREGQIEDTISFRPNPHRTRRGT